MLEKEIIVNCAPTLAALKTGNLFACTGISLEDLKSELLEINEKLNCKGVYLELLSGREGRFLIYAYRPDKLRQDLSAPRVRGLLSAYGYSCTSLTACLDRLKTRLAKCPCFPHEIGIFLGYPIDDVIGFIRNEGKHCKGFCRGQKHRANDRGNLTVATVILYFTSIQSPLAFPPCPACGSFFGKGIQQARK